MGLGVRMCCLLMNELARHMALAEGLRPVKRRTGDMRRAVRLLHRIKARAGQGAAWSRKRVTRACGFILALGKSPLQDADKRRVAI
jgi:hypothetical protein